MCIYFSELTDDQQVTVREIFADLPQSNIPWTSVLDLFKGLNGSITVSTRMIRVALPYDDEKPKVGIFTCLNETGCVSSHMIGALQDLLRGVGVEPQ